MLSLCGWIGQCGKNTFLSKQIRKVNRLKVSYSDAMLESVRPFPLLARPYRHELGQSC